MTIYSIGYGHRAISDFIDLLKHYSIQLLVDTRSIPYSRFQVNFRKQALQKHLEDGGIGYLYLGEVLGGKKVEPDCLVNGKPDLELLLQKESFRGGLDQVEAQSRSGITLALMCAELRPENCHRAWMLAPALERRGLDVLHIDEHGGLKTTQEVGGWFCG
jgi:uncharacterized protein (DUF488 family)